jgi:DNA polymerase III delta prime subunit
MPRSPSETSAAPARPGPLDARERRNRADLRAQVRALWVAGALRQAPHRRLWRELGLSAHPDALALPARALVAAPGAAPQPLAPGRSLRDLFAAGGGRLLILGPPGSGKSSALLALAEALLDAADADEALPIPVVFPLASWAARRSPLAAWLVEELARSYKVPPPLGAAWVAGGVVLPLLDGLDEVGPADADRAACLEAIAAHLAAQGGPAVVCGAGPDARRLPAGAALELPPLAAVRADAYLAQLGPPLASLRAAVAGDGALRELAASPLLLNVMALAYRGQPAPAPAGAAEQRVWADFVARRLAMPLDGAAADPEQLRAWLVWLARGMAAHRQQVFQVEYLQPGWLATRGQRRLFFWVSNIGFTLLVCALGFLLSGLLGGVLGSVAAGALLLLLGVLGGGRVAGLLFDRRRTARAETLRGGLRRLLDRSSLGASVRRTLVGLAALFASAALAAALLHLLVGRRFDELLGALASRPLTVLNIAVLAALVAVLGGGLLDVAREEGAILVRVEPEGRGGRWRAMLAGGLQRGLPVALVVGLALGVQAGPTAGAAVGAAIGLLVGVLGALLGGVFDGLSHGSGALVKHAVLRWLLHRRCGAPWDFVAALDEAAERGLMTRVGGGYCFAHRRLQEHFAAHERPALPVAPILGPREG